MTATTGNLVVYSLDQNTLASLHDLPFVSTQVTTLGIGSLWPHADDLYLNLGNATFRLNYLSSTPVLESIYSSFALSFLIKDDAIYLGYNRGLMKSVDDGDSWSEIRLLDFVTPINQSENLFNVYGAIDLGERVLLATRYGLYETNDFASYTPLQEFRSLAISSSIHQSSKGYLYRFNELFFLKQNL
jgi:hypothetical protein